MQRYLLVAHLCVRALGRSSGRSWGAQNRRCETWNKEGDVNGAVRRKGFDAGLALGSCSRDSGWHAEESVDSSKEFPFLKASKLHVAEIATWPKKSGQSGAGLGGNHHRAFAAGKAAASHGFVSQLAEIKVAKSRAPMRSCLLCDCAGVAIPSMIHGPRAQEMQWQEGICVCLCRT